MGSRAEQFRLAACVGKQSFKDHSTAEKAAKRKPGRKVYRCEFCHEWHVGTSARASGRGTHK